MVVPSGLWNSLQRFLTVITLTKPPFQSTKEYGQQLDDYKVDKSIVVDCKNYYISDNNTIVGICGFYIPLVDKNAAWLSWLAVKEDYKNKGYASEAISIIEKYCESNYGIKTFRVYTSNKNKPAINLYGKLGYILEDTICSHDAVVFTKNGKQWGKDPVW